MSGICGIIHFDGRPVEPGLIEGMTRAMAYRGPDGLHHWEEGNVALGHCVLRTTPESFEEEQPWRNEDGSLVLVLDGWLSNWVELRRELLSQGAILRNRSDAELVLRAVERWGPECVHHLEGDFAWVAWDARGRRVLGARDPLGHKALHYHWDGKSLSFSTDPRPLLGLPWVEAGFNEAMAAEFLAMRWHSRDETFWRSILRVPPSHSFEGNERGLRIREHWVPEAGLIEAGTSEEAIIEAYRVAFVDSVRRHARASGPVACEVSGGLDSSAIFATALDLERHGALPAAGVRGFTLGFQGAGEADEMRYVDAVAEFTGRPVETVPPTLPPLDWYPGSAARTAAFPGFPNGVMGLGIRQRAVEAGCRILLVGVGGDEWLGGNRAYYADALAGGHLLRFLGHARRDAASAGILASCAWSWRHGLIPLLPARVREAGRILLKRLRGGAGGGFKLHPVMEAQLKASAALDRRSWNRAARRPSQRLLWNHWDAAYGAHARESEERIAAMAGVELRRPFFAPGFVQEIFRIPAEFLLRGNINKWVHRRALRPLLPAAVIDRPDKADFMIAFRAQGDGLLGRFKEPGWRDQALRWIPEASLHEVEQGFGDAQKQGIPEWSLWALWGCLAVQGSQGRGHAQDPASF